MPLRLEPPKKGRTSFYRIRGTHLGAKIDQTAGTGDKQEAAAIKASIEKSILARIKRGEPIEQPKPSKGPDFLTALIAYLESGGDGRFTDILKFHLMETPIADIDQARIDKAAAILYPAATTATRNRQVYTPIIAILRRAGIKTEFSRPIGANGKRRKFSSNRLTPMRYSMPLIGWSQDSVSC